MSNQPFSLESLNDFTMSINSGPRLDNNNAHELVEILTQAQSNGYQYIIMDMSQLTFISSAGVGSILGTVEAFRSRGGDIVLCNVPAEIMHILRVLDLVEYLTVKNSAEDAAHFCRAATR